MAKKQTTPEKVDIKIKGRIVQSALGSLVGGQIVKNVDKAYAAHLVSCGAAEIIKPQPQKKARKPRKPRATQNKATENKQAVPNTETKPAVNDAETKSAE